MARDIDVTFEIRLWQGSLWKKGLSQSPVERATLMPLSQRLSSTAAAQHCSWVILEINKNKLQTSCRTEKTL